VLLALVALSAVSALWWWPSGGSSHQPGPTSVAREAPPAPSPVPSVQPPSAGPPDARAVLAALDLTRSRAFARRDPALLDAVYASPALAARDRAELLSIVPTGCGLRGVRTRFRDVSVSSRTATRIQVVVRGALTPSALYCDGARSGHAAGTGVAALRITLVRRGASYLIEREERSGHSERAPDRRAG
jgi:hypothetical protein